MQFTVVSSPRAQHQLQHQAAMIAGLRSLGIDAIGTMHTRVKTDYVACWGWRVGKALRAAGHEVLVMERGYLGDRFSWTSLAWNGLNARGEFPPAPENLPSRFSENFTMKPWKKSGDYIVVMGQVPGDASLQGRSLMPWYHDVCRELMQLYKLPVFFRPHPMALKKGFKQSIPGVNNFSGSLEQCLENAALVVTYNSNAAVDAVIAGVPAVSMDIGSMARDVTSHSLGVILMHDRDAWAEALAWKQWRLSEIENGQALKHLLRGIHD